MQHSTEPELNIFYGGTKDGAIEKREIYEDIIIIPHCSIIKKQDASNYTCQCYDEIYVRKTFPHVKKEIHIFVCYEMYKRIESGEFHIPYFDIDERFQS